MASINSSSKNAQHNTTAGSSNMYRVGDYVYFEAQQQSVHVSQQQPFQIRRIEELNKTSNGNVEAKVMCFYRRRDLPAQLVALADKHQQHQQLQQLSLTMSLSPSGNSDIKSEKHTEYSKDTSVEKKEHDKKITRTEEDQSSVKTETTDGTESVKEDQSQSQDIEMADAVEADPVASAVVKNCDLQGAGNDGDINDTRSDIGKDYDKSILAAQQQLDWWRGEQLKQRELFLSRQVETLAATHIRGKCTVTLYNETESLDSYLEKEDTFFYCLVFDPVQKTLLADKGEIRVGHKYQAEVPPKPVYNRGSGDLKMVKSIKGEIVKEERRDESMEFGRDNEDKKIEIKSSTTVSTVTAIGTVMTMESDSELETLVWTCRPQWNRLTDRQIDQFLVVSRSLGTFARALDCTSSVKQPSLHMSAAAASRDITLFHAMDTLHRHGYDLGTATCSLVPSTGPVLCRDEMEEWSASEANLFEEALEKYGKDFGDIRHDFLPWKTHKNIVEYYYMWKTTDRYVQQKRVKAVEQESKLKQVYIPFYNGTNTGGGKQHSITSGVTIKSSQTQQLVNGNSGAVELYSSKNSSGVLSIADGPLLPGVCDLCDVVTSQQWYPNTLGITTGIPPVPPYHQQNGGLSSVASSTLCHECYTHWKKYGGPRTATSDKKVIAPGRGESISGDEDRPHSNASSGSVALAMNLNISAGGGRLSSHIGNVSVPHPYHHINYHNNQPPQQLQSATSPGSGGGLLLHQPHINSSGSSTIAHRCTIIGCQVAPFKSKSQLLRHYSSAHGIGINSNSSSTTIITQPSGSSGGFDSGTLSSSSISHHNSGGALNLNSNSNSIQQHQNSISGTANQVINLVASSFSPQQHPNNLSSSGGTNTALNIGPGSGAMIPGRPVMKTRTAFYLRCTSLAKASRRRAARQAASALLQQHHQKKSSSSGTPSDMLSPSMIVQPGCLARPRNVARRPFICVPQAAHAYKHECMLSMQHAPVHELRAYLRAAAVKAHARRPGVTRVANALIAARRGRGGPTAADLAVPDWLSLPSQQHQQHQSSHHHVSSSSVGSKYGKHSSNRSSTGGRVAFPKPPKAPDGSLLYERVPNKQDVTIAQLTPASAVGLNPAAAAVILGALGPPGSMNSVNTIGPGLSNDQSASGFDVAAALYQQQQQQQQHQQQQQQQQQQSTTSSSNKRRIYDADSVTIQKQPQPQVGPPSKRMHRQQHQPLSSNALTLSTLTSQGTSVAGGGAVDGMLASLVAQQQQRSALVSGSPLQLTTSGNSGKSSGSVGHQQVAQPQQHQHNHYRTPSMARTGRKHVISWTDAPDDLYYRCTALSRSLRKARMTGKELRRSARKPWQPIAALLGISFTMPSAPPPSSGPGAGATSGSQASQSSISVTPSSKGSSTPFDMSTTGGGRQSSTTSGTGIIPPCVINTPVMSSSRSSGGSGHH